MKNITVHTPFNLNHPVEGKDVIRHFPTGRHTVTDEEAEHWYVKAHSGVDKEPQQSPDFEEEVSSEEIVEETTKETTPQRRGRRK